MRGDEGIDKSERKRSLRRDSGLNLSLNAIKEGKSMPEKSNSNSVGSSPWPTTASSSMLGQLRRSCTNGSSSAMDLWEVR